MKKYNLRKSFALFSLFTLVAVPSMALAVTYGTPITINNPTPNAYETFGYSVAIDGNKFVVGAPNDDIAANDSGSAYLFDSTTGALLQTFNNPTPASDDIFGWSVSISGGKVLIGARGDDTGATNAGSAYLYDVTTGALLHTFNNPTPEQNDSFGHSVSIYGDQILIGAFNDNTGALQAGSAYLYNATTGALLQTFYNPTPSNGEGFGLSVFIYDDKMLVGSNDVGIWGSNVGAVYLYDTTTGLLLQIFNNPLQGGSAPGFGSSVSMSGNKVLIGSAGEDTGAFNAGSAYLYDITTGALLQTFHNPSPAQFDYFGWSVSLSGDKVLIGEQYYLSHLYDVTTGTLLHTFNNPGFSVSVSDANVLIGSPYDSHSTSGGVAYLYIAFVDTDGDGIADNNDNCPTVANPDQADSDTDGIGNVCDSTPNGDADNDGSDNLADNCPADANADQADTDGDGQGDVCDTTPNGDSDNDGVDNLADNCPADANPNQADTDGDGEGDICDFTPNGDTDGDDVDELSDNCPGMANAGQEDNDNDGIGNVCDPTPDGDPDPNPTNVDQCKQLGWVDFGFRNQGQCVAFVNTGHDSR